MKTTKTLKTTRKYPKKLTYMYVMFGSVFNVFLYSWIACFVSVVMTVLLKRFKGMYVYMYIYDKNTHI